MNLRMIIIALLLPLAQSPARAGSDMDAAIDDLNKSLQERAEFYNKLNAANPMSDQYGKGTAPTGPGAVSFQGKAPSASEARLLQVLSSPAVQGYLRLFSSQAFSRGIDEVIKSPNRALLAYAELGLLLFMIVFRAWRFSKCRHWFAKLWANAWTLAMGIALSVGVVPSIVIGQGYVSMLQGVLELMQKPAPTAVLPKSTR